MWLKRPMTRKYSPIAMTVVKSPYWSLTGVVSEIAIYISTRMSSVRFLSQPTAPTLEGTT
jgi:hypothetical protein